MEVIQTLWSGLIERCEVWVWGGRIAVESDNLKVISNFILKQTTIIFTLIFCMLTLTQCKNDEQQKKKPILLADREAPLGWNYLRVFEDSTFEFESRGLERKGDIYSGTVRITPDTLFFNYTDSIPRAGQTAIYNSTTIAYIDGQYPERMSIKLNEITR
jgi:hypothetical protein